jgi:hypothetical protein
MKNNKSNQHRNKTQQGGQRMKLKSVAIERPPDCILNVSIAYSGGPE